MDSINPSINQSMNQVYLLSHRWDYRPTNRPGHGLFRGTQVVKSHLVGWFKKQFEASSRRSIHRFFLLLGSSVSGVKKGQLLKPPQIDFCNFFG